MGQNSQNPSQKRESFSAPSEKEDPIDSTIFVLSTFRSGSTLLARTLGEHSAVFYSRQRHFELSPDLCRFARIKIAAVKTNIRSCPPYNESHASDSIARSLRNGLSQVLGEKTSFSKSRLLVKNPHLWNKVRLITEIFPKSSFIVLSRDILSTVASTKMLLKRIHKEYGVYHFLPEDPLQCWQLIFPGDNLPKNRMRLFPGGDVSVLAEYWCRVYRHINSSMPNFQKVIYVSHNRLVEDFNGVMDHIFEELALPKERIYPRREIESSRNLRWHKKLSRAEIGSLREFLSRNLEDIKELSHALPFWEPNLNHTRKSRKIVEPLQNWF